MVPPLGLHFHVEIEEHLLLEVLLEPETRRGPDVLDHRTRLTDDDRLLRFALDEDRAIELQQPGL